MRFAGILSAASSWIGIRDEPTPAVMPSSNNRVVLVNTLYNCRRTCERLEREVSIAVDMEGVDLGRHGQLSLIQIGCVNGDIFVFDITVLGQSAFSRGLKSLLESKSTEKVLFDGRADADAVYHLYGVAMHKGLVIDVQYLYCRRHHDSDTFLKGLEAAVTTHLLSGEELQAFQRMKHSGRSLFAPERGGTYSVWTRRPLSADLLEYAAWDVKYLLDMAKAWHRKDVHSASSRRLIEAVGRDGIFGPRKDFATYDDEVGDEDDDRDDGYDDYDMGYLSDNHSHWY